MYKWMVTCRIARGLWLVFCVLAVVSSPALWWGALIMLGLGYAAIYVIYLVVGMLFIKPEIPTHYPKSGY